MAKTGVGGQGADRGAAQEDGRGAAQEDGRKGVRKDSQGDGQKGIQADSQEGSQTSRSTLRRLAPLAGRIFRAIWRGLSRLLQPSFWTTLLMVGLIALVGWELTRERLYVEPFGVPPALAARGYSAQAVPSLILDQVTAIQSEARTRKSRRRLEAEWRAQDIAIPGVGLSIRPLVRFLRGTLGLPETRVQGSLLCDSGACAAGEVAITLRVEGAGAPPRSFALDEGRIDALLLGAARFLLREIDTYVLAAYLYQTPPDGSDPESRAARDREVLSLVDLIVARGRPEDQPYAESLRGLVLTGQGNYDGAIAAFERFALLDPDGELGATTYVNWAKALAAQGDEAAAFAKLDEATALDPEDPYVLAARGELLFAAGRADEAIPVLEQALAREPDNAVARLLLAGALAQTGQTAAAEVQRDAAVAANPQVAQLIKERGSVALAANAMAAAPHAEVGEILAPEPIEPPPPTEPTGPPEPPIQVTALPPLPTAIVPPATPTDVPPIPKDPPDKLPGGGGTIVEPPPPEAPEPPAPLVVYFQVGSARLDANAGVALAGFAKALSELPDLAVSITGHADRVGSDERNEQLSLQRAAAVKTFLEAQGLAGERLGLGGRGESDPAVATPDEVPEPANRRVEVVVRLE